MAWQGQDLESNRLEKYATSGALPAAFAPIEYPISCKMAYERYKIMYGVSQSLMRDAQRV